MALIQFGPRIQITIGLEKTAAERLLADGKPLPPPKTGYALIDTGASCTCIDDDAARTMGLPIIDVVKGSSATHANVDQNVYPTQIEIVGTNISIGTPRALGAKLAGADLLALIGRDFLQNCVMIYNGMTGDFTLASS